MIVNLKKLRIQSGYSQRELANMISVSQQSINKYENHNVEPEIATLINLANAFHVSVDYLIGNTDIPNIIEKVSKYDLNNQESELIDSYRQLTDSEKASIKMVIDNYLLSKKR